MLPLQRSTGSLLEVGPSARPISSQESEAVISSSIVSLLWTYCGFISTCVGLSLLIAVLYLLMATKVYRATAAIILDTGMSTTLGDRVSGPRSENYNQTRAEEIRTLSVLRRAAEQGNLSSLKTYEGVTDDIALSLQRSASLAITPSRRSDIVNISMESPFPEDATRIVDAITADILVLLSIRSVRSWILDAWNAKKN